MEKKYELTNETFNYGGHILHRIKAVRDFNCIKVGELGGWVESEDNLSHEGNCWVYDDAKVYDNAVVKDNAKVCGHAVVYDNAGVKGDAQVTYLAKVYSYALVFGDALVSGETEVYGDAKVYDRAMVCGIAKVYDRAMVCDYARVCGDARVCDHAQVYGNAVVCGNVEICGDAVVKETKDYAVFKNTWSSGRYFTWTRSNNLWRVGCFYGTGKQLIKKAYADGELKGKCYEAIVQLQSRISELLK